MPNKDDAAEKRERAISACLDQFVTKGLYETTSRDLSKALKLQSGGMYSYFSNKDEAVILCAEEAIILLEKYLVIESFKYADDIERLFSGLVDRARKLAPMMQFIAQVNSIPKYKEQMRPILDELDVKYKNYAKEFGMIFNSEAILAEKYFYFAISAVVDFMIFGNEKRFVTQIDYIKQVFCQWLDNGDKK